MPRNYQPKVKFYTEASIATAVEEVKNGATVYKTAKKYHMSISMLRNRVLEANGKFERKKQDLFEPDKNNPVYFSAECIKEKLQRIQKYQALSLIAIQEDFI